MNGIFITIKDVMRIYGCEYDAAYRKLRSVKDTLGTKKKPKKYVTLKEFCSEMLIDEQEAKEALG